MPFQPVYLTLLPSSPKWCSRSIAFLPTEHLRLSIGGSRREWWDDLPISPSPFRFNECAIHPDHAIIDFASGSIRLRHGRGGGTVRLNGHSLDPEHQVVLHDGDTLELGGCPFTRPNDHFDLRLLVRVSFCPPTSSPAQSPEEAAVDFISATGSFLRGIEELHAFAASTSHELEGVRTRLQDALESAAAHKCVPPRPYGTLLSDLRARNDITDDLPEVPGRSISPVVDASTADPTALTTLTSDSALSLPFPKASTCVSVPATASTSGDAPSSPPLCPRSMSPRSRCSSREYQLNSTSVLTSVLATSDEQQQANPKSAIVSNADTQVSISPSNREPMLRLDSSTPLPPHTSSSDGQSFRPVHSPAPSHALQNSYAPNTCEDDSAVVMMRQTSDQPSTTPVLATARTVTVVRPGVNDHPSVLSTKRLPRKARRAARSQAAWVRIQQDAHDASIANADLAVRRVGAEWRRLRHELLLHPHSSIRPFTAPSSQSFASPVDALPDHERIPAAASTLPLTPLYSNGSHVTRATSAFLSASSAVPYVPPSYSATRTTAVVTPHDGRPAEILPSQIPVMPCDPVTCAPPTSSRDHAPILHLAHQLLSALFASNPIFPPTYTTSDQPQITPAYRSPYFAAPPFIPCR